MDTTELRTFLAVAELGSFSQASMRLGVPQTTLSRQIGRLEQQLGGSLFDRNVRGMSLTELGTQLRSQTEALVGILDQTRDEIIVHNNEASGQIRFGIPPSIGRSMAASIVAAFRTRCPSAQLFVMEAFSGKLAEWLEAGVVDVAILYDERRSPNMSVAPLLREELFLVGRPDSLPDSDPVPIDQIDTDRLILHSKGEGLRRAIDACFESAGITFTSSLEIDSVATLKVLAESEGLMTILPRGAILRELSEGRLIARRITGAGDLTALLVLGTALSKPVTKSTRELLKIIDEQVVEFGIQAGTAESQRR
jgi:LysR family transcriptional regulator, nitrogen assimilation regulatory protein